MKNFRMSVRVFTLLAWAACAASFNCANAASGFSESVAGTLTIAACSGNVSEDRCGYFIGEDHVNLPKHISAKLQRELNENLNQDVCGYFNNEVLVEVAPAPCSI